MARFAKTRRRFPQKTELAHAWGLVTVGLALVLGIIPLGREVSPKHPPWWQMPGLAIGAVLLAVGILMFVLPHLAVKEPGPKPPFERTQVTIRDGRETRTDWEEIRRGA